MIGTITLGTRAVAFKIGHTEKRGAGAVTRTCAPASRVVTCPTPRPTSVIGRWIAIAGLFSPGGPSVLLVASPSLPLCLASLCAPPFSLLLFAPSSLPRCSPFSLLVCPRLVSPSLGLSLGRRSLPPPCPSPPSGAVPPRSFGRGWASPPCGAARHLVLSPSAVAEGFSFCPFFLLLLARGVAGLCCVSFGVACF